MSEQVSMEQAYRELQQALFDAVDRIRELEAERDAAMDAGMDLTKRLTDACLKLEQAKAKAAGWEAEARDTEQYLKAENTRLRELLRPMADDTCECDCDWCVQARRALEGSHD